MSGDGADTVSVLDDLAADVTYTLLTRDGTVLLAVLRDFDDNEGLWRIQVAPTYQASRVTFTSPHTDLALDGASADGRVILAVRDVIYVDDGRVVHLPGSDEWALQGGDVSEDGTRVVVAWSSVKSMPRFEPRNTHPRHPPPPIEIWGFDLTSKPIKGHPIDASGKATSRPTFVPGTHGEEIVYQSTEDASKECRADRNACHHDILRRRFDGTGTVDLVRRNATGVRFSSDGRHMVYLSGARPATGRLSVFVGSLDGGSSDRLVVKELAANRPVLLSPDGTWLAYDRSQVPTVRDAHLVGTDSNQDHALGNVRPIGWLAGPLPRGADMLQLPAPGAWTP